MPNLPLVIVNPASAGGRTKAVWPAMASDLRTHFGAFNCALTKAAGDGRRIAAREAACGREFIIACGGDGTISEVVNGILESGAQDVELGILPSGTGGDFRRTLRIPTRAADAALALRRGEQATNYIDVGRVTYHTARGEQEARYFVNVASIGMGSRVVERVESSSSWLPVNGSTALGGNLAYATAAAQTVLSFTKPEVSIQIDDKPPRRFRILNLCVANARYFGGGMKIAPEAKLNDGLLDVVVVGDLSAATVFANAYRLYLGTHLGMQQVAHTRAERITVCPAAKNRVVSIEVDGELAGHLPATFEILPRALKIRVVA